VNRTIGAAAHPRFYYQAVAIAFDLPALTVIKAAMWESCLAPTRVQEPYASIFVTEIGSCCVDYLSSKIELQRLLLSLLSEDLMHRSHSCLI